MAQWLRCWWYDWSILIWLIISQKWLVMYSHCMHVYIYICIHINMYMYIYIYIHNIYIYTHHILSHIFMVDSHWFPRFLRKPPAPLVPAPPLAWARQLASCRPWSVSAPPEALAKSAKTRTGWTCWWKVWWFPCFQMFPRFFCELRMNRSCFFAHIEANVASNNTLSIRSSEMSLQDATWAFASPGPLPNTSDWRRTCDDVR